MNYISHRLSFRSSNILYVYIYVLLIFLNPNKILLKVNVPFVLVLLVVRSKSACFLSNRTKNVRLGVVLSDKSRLFRPSPPKCYKNTWKVEHIWISNEHYHGV